MHTKIAGLLGAVGMVAVATSAVAAPACADHVARVAPYADLVRLIPNAGVTLQASDGRAPATVLTVQFYRHHHRHFRHYRRHYRSFLTTPNAPKPV